MMEPLYSSEQIKIPPELPEILKNYAKFIIKTQPEDIYLASAEYFERLSKQRSLTDDGKRLSNAQLEAFYSKFIPLGEKALVTRKDIEEASLYSNIGQAQVQDVATLGSWRSDKIPWVRFWALLCASAAGSLLATIEVISEIAGDAKRVPSGVISEVFSFLIQQDKTVEPEKAGKTTRALETLSLSTKTIAIVDLVSTIKTEMADKPPEIPKANEEPMEVDGAAQ